MYHIYVCDAGLWSWYESRQFESEAKARTDELNAIFETHPRVWFVYRHQNELQAEWMYESVRG